MNILSLFAIVVALVLASEVHHLLARDSKVVGITTASYDGKMTQYYFDSNGYGMEIFEVE